MLNRARKYISKNNVSKGILAPLKLRAFRSRVPAQVWQKMSYVQRNAHKAKQALFKKAKRLLKIKFAVNKRLVGYDSTHRKLSKRRRFRSTIRIPELTAAIRTRKALRLRTERKNSIYFANETYAFKHTFNTRGIGALKKQKLVKTSSKRLYSVFKFPRSITKNFYEVREVSKESNKIIYWDVYLPVYCLFSMLDYKSMIVSADFIQLVGEGTSLRIDRREYGCILFVNNVLDTTEESVIGDYEILKSYPITYGGLVSAKLKEDSVVGLYSNLLNHTDLKQTILMPRVAKPRVTLGSWNTPEKRGHLKHVIRMRYRWFFQPRLSQFKLFKKFFKRSLKRYRKINKNKLFVSKFRSHFPKLTGFTEKGLLQMWLPFRRGYNQYWSNTNAVLRFSQSLLLAPASLLVFLQLSPSFAASKFIVKSGAVSINGLAVTAFTQFKPGDIMQLNFVIWRSVRHFFDYQRWNNDRRPLQHVSFLQVDWSSLMFMMVRWPRRHELIAPSFLSERWVRYYIRHFPSKIRNFRKADGNWKVYKRIITKR